MSLLDVIRGIPERMGRGMERNIGGLLGIDPEDMTEEERRQARRLSQMAVFDAMARGTSPIAGLRQAAELLGTQRAEREQRREAEQRMGAAQQASGQIAGRLMGAPQLFGRTKEGEMTSIYDTPAQQQAKIEADIAQQRASGQLQDVTPTARYIRDPQDALRMAMTPAGVDAMQINPFLQPALQEAMKPPAPTNYEFRNVEGVGLFAINPTNPADMRLLQAEKKEASPALPQLKAVQLEGGMVQDQWVLPGESSGTPLGVPYKSGTSKPLSSELVTKLTLGQSLRDAEGEIAKLNPSVATSAFQTFRTERMKSADLKQYETAAKRWAQNLNYFKSGAQSGPQEIEENWKQYFPVAGDDDKTIELKNRQRRQEMANIEEVLRLAGVENVNLSPYPVINIGKNNEGKRVFKDGDAEKQYNNLPVGSIYMDADGRYVRKK